MPGYLVIIGINSDSFYEFGHFTLFIHAQVVLAVLDGMRKGRSVGKYDNCFIKSAPLFYKFVDTLTLILVKMQIRSG